MTRSGQSNFDKKAASPPHTDGSIVFARLRQRASHVTHASLGPFESTTRTASRSVQPFFAGLTTVTERQTDRPTDHATRSVTIGRICVRCTTMRPKKENSHKRTVGCDGDPALSRQEERIQIGYWTCRHHVTADCLQYVWWLFQSHMHQVRRDRSGC